MARGDIETYYEEGHWKNKVEGSGQAAHVHTTKAHAETKGREMAMNRKVEHVIKTQDGAIGERNSYGSTTADIPGQPG